MSYARAVSGAFVATILWVAACALSVFIPNRIGGLVPLAGTLATIRDMEKMKSGPATLAALVSMFLAFAIGDRVTATLYVIAVILGLISILRL